MESTELRRSWDSFRLALFAVLLTAGLTVGVAVGVAYSWTFGLIAFVATIVVLYMIMRCHHTREAIFRFIEPLLKKPKPPRS